MGRVQSENHIHAHACRTAQAGTGKNGEGSLGSRVASCSKGAAVQSMCNQRHMEDCGVKPQAQQPAAPSVERQVGRAVGGAAKLGKGIWRGCCRCRRRHIRCMLLHHLHEQLVPPRVLQTTEDRVQGYSKLRAGRQALPSRA